MTKYTRSDVERITRKSFEHEMDKCRRLGIPTVRVVTAHDSCPACRELAEKVYALDDVPELPHAACTHETGCRCAIEPADVS